MDEAKNEIVTVIENRAAIVRLNRPKALNAVTLAIIHELSALYHACAKNPHIYGAVMEAEGKRLQRGRRYPHHPRLDAERSRTG